MPLDIDEEQVISDKRFIKLRADLQNVTAQNLPMDLLLPHSEIVYLKIGDSTFNMGKECTHGTIAPEWVMLSSGSNSIFFGVNFCVCWYSEIPGVRQFSMDD